MDKLFTTIGTFLDSDRKCSPLFFMQISQSCGFGGLGEDQNISLATKRWKINRKWKTPSADRRVAETVYTIETFFKNKSKVVKTSDWQASSQRRRNDGEYSD